MKIVFFGTPDFAVSTLERLMASRHSVALVVSRPDRPVVEKARQLDLDILQPKNLKSPEVDRALAEIEADAAVVVAYGKLIPTSLLEIPRHGFINPDRPRFSGPWCAATARPA